jgi:Flp pilus assembly protein TadD
MAVIGSTPPQPTEGRPIIVPVSAACAALLAVAVYLNALQNPFVYDDFRLIVENPSILNLWDLKSVIVRDITRPLVNLSYAVDTTIWGRIPFAYHVTNVVLHALNVMLVFWVALLAARDRRRQRGEAAWTAGAPQVIGFASAAVFAVHPMMTEAVGYVTGRSEVLFSFFFLLGFLSGRRWMIGGGRLWWGACVGSWIAAMLAKETAAMLPAALLAYDWFVLAGDPAERRRRFRGLQLPMLAFALTAGVARIAVLQLIESPVGSGVDSRYALVQIETVWRYVVLLLVPRGQSIFHSVSLIESFVSLRALANIAALAAVVALAWRLRRENGLVGFGLVWFLMLLLPPAVLFALGRGEAMVERRAYLPSAGLFLIVGYSFGGLWARAGRQRLLAAAAAAVFIGSLSFLTVMRNVIWQDPVALTREAARLAPGQWMPRVLVGEAFRQSGQCTDAVKEYRAAIDIRPREEFPYTRLAGCLIEMRELDQAEEVLRALRGVNPTSQDAAMGLGIFALLDGRSAEARAYLQAAANREPPRPRAGVLLAFMDGTLPASETRRVCDELRTVAGVSLNVETCQSDSHQVDRDPRSRPSR